MVKKLKIKFTVTAKSLYHSATIERMTIYIVDTLLGLVSSYAYDYDQS